MRPLRAEARAYDLRPRLHYLTPLATGELLLTMTSEITSDSGELNTHHFSMLRRVLEQTAAFFGYESWAECLGPREGKSAKAFQKRVLDLNSQGDYVIFESSKIDEEKRSAFRAIFEEFRCSFPFNPALFPAETVPAAAPEHDAPDVASTT